MTAVEEKEAAQNEPAKKKKKATKRKQPAAPLVPTAPKHWPLHMTGDDNDLLNSMPRQPRLKIWLDASGGFRLEELIAHAATLKIHDWYCYTGLLGAFCLQQCEGNVC